MACIPCDLCTLLAAPADGVLIWRDQQLSVIAVDDAEYPGYTRVVWNAHVREMTDLSVGERQHVMAAVWAVEAAQRAIMSPKLISSAPGSGVASIQCPVLSSTCRPGETASAQSTVTMP